MSEPAKFEFVVKIGLDASLLAIVSALCANAGIKVPAAEAKPARPTPPTPANAGTAGSSANTTSESGDATTSANGSTSASATNGASPSENDGKTDAAGTVFDPARHTGTIVKSGLWRMKTGLSRPEHEGESAIPKAGTETKTPPPPGKTPPPPPVKKPAVDPNRPTDPAFIHDNGDGTELWYVNDAWDAGHPVPEAAAAEEDDEFAAFATAGKVDGASSARSWTDADLSKLCNDAAVKDGGPTKVKPIIAKYIPEGQTQHSRNIPQPQREAFAQEIEAACGITFEPA